MDVVTAGTTQSQQAAGKTNHTPEDVSDLRQNFTKKAASLKSLLGKGLMKYTSWLVCKNRAVVCNCVSPLKLAMWLLS